MILLAYSLTYVLVYWFTVLHGLGLGLERHCLGIGLGLGLGTYCLAPITGH